MAKELLQERTKLLRTYGVAKEELTVDVPIDKKTESKFSDINSDIDARSFCWHL